MDSNEDLNVVNHITNGVVIRKYISDDFPLVQKLYEQEGWMTFVYQSDEAYEALTIHSF